MENQKHDRKGDTESAKKGETDREAQAKGSSVIQKRKVDERRSGSAWEEPADRAARITASATKWMAIFTFALVLTSALSWWEIHSGSVDTHNLADAAVASSRAWVAPEQMILDSPVESGLPIRYAVRMVNPGKEPAIGVVWKLRPFGVPYIQNSQPDANDDYQFGPNTTCVGLQPGSVDGVVLYPAGPTADWLPLDIPDTGENRQLVGEVLRKTKSLVIEGCFAYKTGGERHTSSFRFLLRDLPDKPSFVADQNGKQVPAWSFNTELAGNSAN